MSFLFLFLLKAKSRMDKRTEVAACHLAARWDVGRLQGHWPFRARFPVDLSNFFNTSVHLWRVSAYRSLSPSLAVPAIATRRINHSLNCHCQLESPTFCVSRVSNRKETHTHRGHAMTCAHATHVLEFLEKHSKTFAHLKLALNGCPVIQRA